MKKFYAAFLIIICLFSFASCDAPGVYKLDDYLPPLIDITTQYPYITSIEVTDNTSGASLEFVDSANLDSIRMRLEGIKCIREKDDGSYPIVYTIVFNTTDSVFTIGIASENDYVIDGYHYEAMRSGVDMLYFAGLFN